MADEHWRHILAIAMKNRTDGIVTGDILNLSAAEIVFRGQRVVAVQCCTAVTVGAMITRQVPAITQAPAL